MKIPYLNLKQINDSFATELRAAFDEVLDSGWLIMGNKLNEFESSYAQFNSTQYCIGVANGLDALILSLRVLGIGHGDEVIVPSNTYIASWLAVSYVGATPVPVEPRWNTCNINPELIEQKISNKTKAIMPVNLYGQAAELQTISKIASQHQLFVVEDNAQAQGAYCDNKMTGSWGDINATSFYPGKNLGALGDAGAITTNNESYFTQVKTLRNYGSEKKYYNEEKGVNSRLDELQAAFLSVKLKSINEHNQIRQKWAEVYNTELKNISGLVLPENAKGCSSVYHIYQVRAEQRDKLQAHLQEKGIGTLIHYPVPSHLQNAYADLGYKKGDFLLAEKIAEQTLSLPLYPGLTEAELQYIIDSIQEFF